MTPFVAITGSRPSTVNFRVPAWTIHHSRVSPFIRRAVFCPGAIEIHCANKLSSSTTVSDQSASLACRLSTSRSFVCGRCTPVQPGEFALGDRTSSGASCAPSGAMELAAAKQMSASSGVVRDVILTAESPESALR
jgi:hypothetical protein